MNQPLSKRSIVREAAAALALSLILYASVVAAGGGVWWGARGAAAIAVIVLFRLALRSPERYRWGALIAGVIYLLPISAVWVMRDDGILDRQEIERSIPRSDEQFWAREILNAIADSLLYEQWNEKGSGPPGGYGDSLVRIRPAPGWTDWTRSEFLARAKGDTTELFAVGTSPGGENAEFENADGRKGRMQRRLLLTTTGKRHVIDN